MIQNIAHSKGNEIQGCILSIDQTKAFDSVRHDYIAEVLYFFGFGPNMIKMVLTACTGRNDCIIDEDGNYTRNFNLGIGTAQGDCPSPSIFRDYITALQVTWVKRAHLSSRDCWRADLHTLGNGSPLTLNPQEINGMRNPILHNIANSWQIFIKSFNSLNYPN